MDRDALVLRNRTMAEAMHTTSLRHHVRNILLSWLARLPIAQQKLRDRERILLIRPDHLGDVLLATPAIYALRRARPRAEIHALVGPWSAEALANYPEIDVVLTLRFPGFDRNNTRSWRFPYQLALRSARHLRLVGYTSAVIMRHDHWWGAMLAFLAGIPRRIGYDHASVSHFLTEAIAFEQQHAVLQNLRLMQPWTGRLITEQVNYRFLVDSEIDNEYVNTYLERWDIAPDSRYFVIHPGSGTWVKRWEESQWAQVADTLIDQLDASVVFTGSDHERHLVEAIASQMKHRACIMVGDTQLGQLAALLKRAVVVLGPDSGPLHLAAAVGTSTVALFGPADPSQFAPWGSPDKHIVLTSDIGCQPCRILDWGDDNPGYHPCVRDITIGEVLDAARRAANSI